MACSTPLASRYAPPFWETKLVEYTDASQAPAYDAHQELTALDSRCTPLVFTTIKLDAVRFLVLEMNSSEQQRVTRVVLPGFEFGLAEHRSVLQLLIRHLPNLLFVNGEPIALAALRDSTSATACARQWFLIAVAGSESLYWQIPARSVFGVFIQPNTHASKILSLDLCNNAVHDLRSSGLEACTRLQSLLLDCNAITQVEQLGPVSQLRALTHLSVLGNTVCLQGNHAILWYCRFTGLKLLNRLVPVTDADIRTSAVASQGHEVSLFDMNRAVMGALKGPVEWRPVAQYIRWLNISNCGLSTVVVGSLFWNLERLDVSGNRLTAMPVGLDFHASKMTVLRLHNNPGVYALTVANYLYCNNFVELECLTAGSLTSKQDALQLAHSLTVWNNKLVVVNCRTVRPTETPKPWEAAARLLAASEEGVLELDDCKLTSLEPPGSVAHLLHSVRTLNAQGNQIWCLSDLHVELWPWRTTLQALFIGGNPCERKIDGQELATVLMALPALREIDLRFEHLERAVRFMDSTYLRDVCWKVTGWQLIDVHEIRSCVIAELRRRGDKSAMEEVRLRHSVRFYNGLYLRCKSMSTVPEWSRIEQDSTEKYAWHSLRVLDVFDNCFRPADLVRLVRMVPNAVKVVINHNNKSMEPLTLDHITAMSTALVRVDEFVCDPCFQSSQEEALKAFLSVRGPELPAVTRFIEVVELQHLRQYMFTDKPESERNLLVAWTQNVRRNFKMSNLAFLCWSHLVGPQPWHVVLQPSVTATCLRLDVSHNALGTDGLLGLPSMPAVTVLNTHCNGDEVDVRRVCEHVMRNMTSLKELTLSQGNVTEVRHCKHREWFRGVQPASDPSRLLRTLNGVLLGLCEHIDIMSAASDSGSRTLAAASILHTWWNAETRTLASPKDALVDDDSVCSWVQCHPSEASELVHLDLPGASIVSLTGSGIVLMTSLQSLKLRSCTDADAQSKLSRMDNLTDCPYLVSSLSLNQEAAVEFLRRWFGAQCIGRNRATSLMVNWDVSKTVSVCPNTFQWFLLAAAQLPLTDVDLRGCGRWEVSVKQGRMQPYDVYIMFALVRSLRFLDGQAVTDDMREYAIRSIAAIRIAFPSDAAAFVDEAGDFLSWQEQADAAFIEHSVYTHSDQPRPVRKRHEAEFVGNAHSAGQAAQPIEYHRQNQTSSTAAPRPQVLVDIHVAYLQTVAVIMSLVPDMQWPDVVSVAAVLPYLSVLDISYLFDVAGAWAAINSASGRAAKLLLAATCPAILMVAFYMVYSSTLNEWTRKYLTEWPYTRFNAVSVMFIALGSGLGLLTLWMYLSGGGILQSPTAVALFAGWSGVCAVGFMSWFIVSALFRRRMLLESTPQGLQATWSSMKRVAGRVLLFGVNVAYLPVIRAVLLEFTSVFDLPPEACAHKLEDRTCCVKSSLGVLPGGSPCVQSPDFTMSAGQAVAAGLGILFGLAVPALFAVLVRSAVRLVDASVSRRSKPILDMIHRNDGLLSRESLSSLKSMIRDTYAEEVVALRTAQTYLIEPFVRRRRYHRVWCILEKLLLMCAVLMFPDHASVYARLVLAVVVTVLFGAASAFPYSTMEENIMDTTMRALNVCNIVYALGRDQNWWSVEWNWDVSLVLVCVNTVLFVVAAARSLIGRHSHCESPKFC